MSRPRLLVGVLATVLFAGLVLAADPKPDDKKDPTPTPTTHRVRGTLPQGWKQLGLTEEQRQKVYQVEDDYGSRIADLKQKILDLQHQQRTEELKILTDAQRARLKEMGEEKAGVETTKTEDPKKEEVKKP